VWVLVGVWQAACGRLPEAGDVGLGNLVEEKFPGACVVLCASAEVAGGDAAVVDGVDGVVGVDFGARTAVGVHVREDADGRSVAGVDENDPVSIGGHGDRADLISAQGYVEVLVGNGFVGLGVDDADVELVGGLGGCN
jgi:hypothetical protein